MTIKFLGVLGLIILGTIGYLLYEDQERRPTSIGEVIPPDEDATTTEILGYGMHLVNKNPATSSDHIYRRDVHAKMQGLLKALMIVKPNLPQQYRYGVFQDPPKSGYHAWIRFSNGDPKVQSDTKKDAHGMAIKLMGVPGKKLLPGEESAPTQDFVMVSHPVFPVSDIHEYGELLRYAAEDRVNAYFVGGPSLNLSKWHPRAAFIAFQSLISPPSSVLNLQFYSQSAYRLGPNQYVKFSAKPCSIMPSPPDVDRSQPDFLREVIKKQLEKSEACFDFMIQLQNRDKNMPVEDPSVLWSESDSPFFPVAQIKILKGDKFDTPQRNQLGENLSFMPWHSLADHEPVGGLNRLRKAVYQQISRYRRAKNGVCFFEPCDWDEFSPKPPCPPDTIQ
jgi:hypothetical protein